jgi:hypothetical protein
VFCAALVCFAAAPAFASTPTTICTGQLAGVYIAGALTVPAGQECKLVGSEVAGNVTVLGSLFVAGAKIDGNVSVTGGTIAIVNSSTLMGNLAITGSAGVSGLYCPNAGQSHNIYGNLSFSGNSGLFYVCQAVVGGNVTVANNVRINSDYSGPVVADLNNITAGKNLTCSGNVSANGGPAVVTDGGPNTAVQKIGQCSGL